MNLAICLTRFDKVVWVEGGGGGNEVSEAIAIVVAPTCSVAAPTALIVHATLLNCLPSMCLSNSSLTSLHPYKTVQRMWWLDPQERWSFQWIT